MPMSEAEIRTLERRLAQKKAKAIAAHEDFVQYMDSLDPEVREEVLKRLPFGPNWRELDLPPD